MNYRCYVSTKGVSTYALLLKDTFFYTAAHRFDTSPTLDNPLDSQMVVYYSQPPSCY
jgi:hypothetical protein